MCDLHLLGQWCHGLASIEHEDYVFLSFQYLAQVLGWRHACESAGIPSSIEDLEEALQQHQALIETISHSLEHWD